MLKPFKINIIRVLKKFRKPLLEVIVVQFAIIIKEKEQQKTDKYKD